MASKRGDLMRDINIFMVTVSIIVAGLRFYVRQFMIRAFGPDDVYAVIAWALLMAQASMEIYSVKLGIGKHIQDVAPEDFAIIGKLFPTQQLAYFATTGFLRLSVAAFLPRLNKESMGIVYQMVLGLTAVAGKFLLRVVYPLQAFIVTVTIVCFTMFLFECKHVPDLWDRYKPSARCTGSAAEAHLFWSHAIIGVATDLTLLIIPLYLVYTRMLVSAKSVRVLMVFGIGVFVIIAGIVRLAIIIPQHYNNDVTYQIVGVALWTDIEEHVGFWVACFPSLQPLVRLVLIKVGLSTASQSNINGITTGQAYAQRSKTRPTIKSRANVSYYEDSESSKGIFELDERERGLKSPTITANGMSQSMNDSQGDLEGGILRVVEVNISQHKV